MFASRARRPVITRYRYQGKKERAVANLKLEPAQFINEQELLEFLNATSNQIASLRRRGMPYLQVGNNLRMYFVPALLDWMTTHGRNQLDVKKYLDL